MWCNSIPSILILLYLITPYFWGRMLLEKWASGIFLLKINTTWFDMVFSNAVKFTRVWLRCLNTFWGHCVNHRSLISLSYFSILTLIGPKKKKACHVGLGIASKHDSVAEFDFSSCLNFGFSLNRKLKLCGYRMCEVLLTLGFIWPLVDR